MKLKKYLVAASICAAIVTASMFSYHPSVHSSSGQPPTRRTGAPGEADCTDCHGDYNVISNSSSVTVSSSPAGLFTTGYTPGTVYSVTLTLANTMSRYGFEMTCLNGSNAAAGTFAVTTSTNTSLQTSSSKQYIGHKSASSLNTWTYKWTAPAAGTGTVTFYGVGLLANGDGSTGGDYVHTHSWAAPEVTTVACNVTVAGSSTAVSCNGGSTGSATATPTGGTAPYTYAWSNGGTTQTISNVAAGTYTVTVTESSTQHCTATASVTVTQPTALAATTTTTAASCGQSNGSATATPSGGTSPYTYSWTGGATTAAASNLASGTYSVTITDAHSCSITKSVTVSSSGAVPTSPGTISGNAVPCAGASSYSVASVSGVTYTWAVSGGGTVTPSSNTASINWTTPGTYTVSVTPSNTCGSGPASTLSVTVGSAPSAPAITGATSACPSASAYSVTQQAGITYAWAVSGGGTVSPSSGSNVTVTWTTPGNYTVSVTPTSSTCGAGTAGTLAVTVSNGGPSAPTISGNASPCPGNNTYTVPTSAGVTYTWAVSSGGTVTPNGASANINWTTLGSHTISVTPTNSCGTGTAGTYSVIVSNNAPAAPTVSGSHTACTSVSSAFSVPATSGVTYAWAASGGGTVSPASGTNTTVTWTTPGTYTVSATPTSSCGTGSAGTYSVTVTASAVAPGPIAGGTSACLNNTPTYTISPATGGGTYTWAVSGGGTVTPSGNSATVHWTTLGTHTISVTPVASCGSASPSTLDVTVTNAAIQPVVTGSNNICSGTATAYNVTAVAGETYTWTAGGGGSIIPNGASSTINWTTGGIYNVSVTATNGCGTSPAGTKSVTVKQSPIVALGNDTTACQSVTLDAGAGYGLYTWSTGASTQSINATASGVYSVTVNASNGCTASATKNVTVNSILPISTLAATTQGCGGATLDAGTYSQYIWSQGATTQTITPSNSGTYSVTVTGAGGCKTSASTVLTIEQSPTASYVYTVNGYTASFVPSMTGGNLTYAWDFGDGTTDNSMRPTHTYTAKGQYAARLTAQNDCGQIRYGDVVTIGLQSGINNVADNDLKVYPNPVENTLVVSLSGESANFELFNQLGETISAGKLVDGTPTQVDMANVARGLYMLRVTTDNKVYTHKVIKN